MKIAVPIDVDSVVKRLPLREKIRLARFLEKQTWASRLDQLFKRIDQRRGSRTLTEGQIVQICKDVRRQLHARGRP